MRLGMNDEDLDPRGKISTKTWQKFFFSKHKLTDEKLKLPNF